MAKIKGAQDWCQVLAWSEDIVTLLVGNTRSKGYEYRVDLTNQAARDLSDALIRAAESNEEDTDEYDAEDSRAIDSLSGEG